ncbi:MAG: DUF2232 domain-containing protein [Rhodospirillales bacterium]|nr:MAG: DUF2232 domain-containing protein [Rhodospirillales bacterium]
MLQTALIAAGGGALSALVSLAAITGAPGGMLLAYFSPLPLMLVGLGLGAAAIPIAALAGIGVVAGAGGVAAAGVYGGLHALPSWLVVHQALIHRPGDASDPNLWTPPGVIVSLLSVFCAGTVVVGAMLAGGDIEAGVGRVMEEALRTAAPDLPEADRAAVTAQITPFFVGAVGGMWVIMIALNAVAAQGLLARRHWNRRPSPRWSEFTVPNWFAWPLVAAAAIGLVAVGDIRYLARNLVLVFAVPYFFAGLAVLHTLARRTGAKGLLLACYYVLLALAFPAIAGATAGLGVIDQWMGIRRRLPGAPPQ